MMYIFRIIVILLRVVYNYKNELFKFIKNSK